MIDIEREIFTGISKELKSAFPGIRVSGEYVNSPVKFPFVSIEEADNRTPYRYSDSGSDRYAEVMYEVNVLSNKTTGKKAECKSIARFIDGWMVGHNFIRDFMHPIPNVGNSTIYRIVCRYRAVSDGKNIYRN